MSVTTMLGPSANHVVIALGIQAVVGGIFGASGAGVLTPWIGAAAASAWFLGREFAQSFRYSNPGAIALEGWKSIRQAGWPIFATHAVAAALTLLPRLAG